MTERDEQVPEPKPSSVQRDAAGLPADDERLSRENIERTGEPNRDALGNEDGAS